MTSKLTRVLVGAAMGAGAVGVILALAGVHSPVRTGLVLLFLAVAPTAAIAGLLRGFDPFARIILAVVSTIAVLTIVAVLLLSTGLWSPIGELVVVAAITAGCLAAQRPAVQARLAAWVRPGWQALLRHIPGDHRAASTPAGAVAGNGQPAPHAEAEAQVPGNGQPAAHAEGEPQVPGNGQAGLDPAEGPVNGQLDTGEAPGTCAAELAARRPAPGRRPQAPPRSPPRCPRSATEPSFHRATARTTPEIPSRSARRGPVPPAPQVTLILASAHLACGWCTLSGRFARFGVRRACKVGGGASGTGQPVGPGAVAGGPLNQAATSAELGLSTA